MKSNVFGGAPLFRGPKGNILIHFVYLYLFRLGRLLSKHGCNHANPVVGGGLSNDSILKDEHN